MVFIKKRGTTTMFQPVKNTWDNVEVNEYVCPCHIGKPSYVPF